MSNNLDNNGNLILVLGDDNELLLILGLKCIRKVLNYIVVEMHTQQQECI